MKIAAKNILVLTIAVSAWQSFGQSSDAVGTNALDWAVTHSVQDQANVLVLRGKLDDAKIALNRGDLIDAGKLYEDAYDLAQQIGSGIDIEMHGAVSGLVEVRMNLAEDDLDSGDISGAKDQINRAAKVDPKNEQVLKLKEKILRTEEMSKGKRPDAETLEKLPAAMEQKKQANVLVQDAKFLYEMGKLEEAEGKIIDALKLDPDNTAANTYYNLIKSANYKRGESAANRQVQDMLGAVEKAYNPVDRLKLPVPNSYATNDAVYTGVGRQAIISKLKQIELDSVSYDPPVPLSEVIRDLKQKIKARDPEKKGINFIISKNAPAPISSPSTAAVPGGVGLPQGATAIDPTTGLPVTPAASAPAEPIDISSYMVQLSLDNVTLEQLLDAIVSQGADHPIKYSILDYGIVFSAKGQDQAQLFERHFRVDPNTFYSGLEGVSSASFGGTSSSGNNGNGNGNGNGNNGNGNSSGGTVIAVVNASPGAGGFRSSGSGNNGNNSGNSSGGSSVTGSSILGGGAGNTGAGNGGAGGGGGGGNSGGLGSGGGGGLRYITTQNLVSDPSVAARAFFTTLGIDMNNPPGKSVVFNDKLGLLFVRATDQDLDEIEQVIQALNTVNPQVHIKSRFIEVAQNDNKALGFDDYLGNFISGKVVANGGSAPSLGVPVSTANPNGSYPGNPANPVTGAASTLIPGSAGDGLLTSGLRNSGPALATITGILTDPNFRIVLHALEQRGGFETLGEPEITTTSGRQVQMRATTIKTVITSINFNNGTSGSTTTVGGTTGNTVNNPGAAAVQPSQSQIEVGPILDVVPYVRADGYTINMALIPSDTEFNGYDTAPTIPGVSTVGGSSSQTVVIVPPILPIFTVRQVITAVDVWDNQTVVLGGLITSSTQSTKDKVPFLGDLPGIGRLFQSQSKTESKDNLMVFVTATIVDPAGNRVHSDDEYPFMQTAIPNQPAVPGQTFQAVNQQSVAK